jgi:hypothetical protein
VVNLERYFDVIYNAISMAFLVALAIAVLRGCLLGRRKFDELDRRHGRGSALAAFGTALALAGGLVADGFLQDSAWFQQVRFGIYFVGFALAVVGISSVLRAAIARRTDFRRFLPGILIWLFVGSLVVSIPFLTIPSTFELNRYHQQVQLVVYWTPLLVASGLGAVMLFVAAVGSPVPARTIWVGVFEALLLLGLLREAAILPDLGDPLVNLSVSFVPFFIGGVAIAIGAGMRRSDQRPGLNILVVRSALVG